MSYNEINQRLTQMEEVYTELLGAVTFSPELEMRFRILVLFAIIVFAFLASVFSWNNYFLQGRIKHLERHNLALSADLVRLEMSIYRLQRDK